MMEVSVIAERVESISERIYYVVPTNRMRALLTKIIIYPSIRAEKNKELAIATIIREKVNAFLENYYPEMITTKVMHFYIREAILQDLVRYLEFVEDIQDLEKKIDKYFTIAEKHVLKIGRIVERLIVLLDDIHDDLKNKKEE